MGRLRLYQWHASDQQGQLRQGDWLAEQPQQVYQSLLQQGLQPYRVSSGRALPRGCWRGEALIQFSLQLGTLLQAGLPLVNSLELLATEHPSAAWRCLLRLISQQVSQGQPLAQVLASFTLVFPPIYSQLIAVGELTGHLDSCCLRLAAQQQQQQQLKKKVLSALRYPIFISLLAIIISLLMLLFVLPEFATLYQNMTTPLPWLTQGLLSFSTALWQYLPYGSLFCATVFASYWHWLHPKAVWQLREQQGLLRLPWVKTLLSGHCLSQLFHILAMTQQAGLSLIAGLDAAALAVNNRLYQQAIGQIQQQLTQGMPLHQTVQQHPLFPPLCAQLIKVGEESGTLDNLLLQLAVWHQQQTLALAERLTAALEPISMLIIATIVGTLLLAMYLPLFQLGDVMAG